MRPLKVNLLAEPFAELEAALVGRYIIERELGHGGMATVFLAQDLKHRRPVALKVLHPQLALTLGVERFTREIDIAAHLTHPHILPLHDSGSADGFLFYVMPYIEGQTLRQRLTREGQLSVDDALRMATEIADALDYAHSKGVVHRDIKPENILLNGEHAMVADFGIARAVSEAGWENLTGTGAAVGTPAYMSPEQARGGIMDGRTDQYALACVVYEMLSGQPPFTGPSAEAVLAGHLLDSPGSLRAVRPTLPRHIVRAIEIALAKAPADRFPSAGEFRAALTGSRPIRRNPFGRAWRTWRRVGLMTGSAALLAFAAWWFGTRGVARFHEKDWVLVADFDGPADDRSLGDAVRELATAELNQSAFLSTVPRQQLAAAMRTAQLPETTHVGPQLARELAYRTAVRAVLVGGISRLGAGNYSVVLHVVDAGDGTDIVSVAGAATDSNLVTSVQRLAREVRAGLGERLSAIEANQPLDDVTTPSFPAFRRYIEGLKLQVQGDGTGSTRVLREALALDTGFASAWWAIAWNFLNDRMVDSARLAFSEVLKRPDRLGVPRRYRAEADADYALRYDLPAAIRAYDLYLDHFPRSYAVLNARGNYLMALGRYEEALKDFAEAVRVYPFGPKQAQMQLGNEAGTLVTLGRTREARSRARALSGPYGAYIAIMLATAGDDWARADSIATDAADAPASPNWLRVEAVTTTAAVRAVRGEVAVADSALARASVRTAPEISRWYGQARLLLAEASGRPAPARPDVASRDTSPSGLVTYGLWAASLGDTATASRNLRRLRVLPAEGLASLGYGADLLQARIAARAGRWNEVVRLIGPAAIKGEHDPTLLDRVNSFSLRWLAAEAYGRLGRPDSAAAMMELLLRPTRMPGNAYALRGLTYSFAHSRLAEWYGQLGKWDAARAHWRVVLDTMQTPDTTVVHYVDEARRGYDAVRSD